MNKKTTRKLASILFQAYWERDKALWAILGVRREEVKRDFMKHAKNSEWVLDAMAHMLLKSVKES